MPVTPSNGPVNYDKADLLAADQRRIATYLTFATARDINDPGATLRVNVGVDAFSVAVEEVRVGDGTERRFQLVYLDANGVQRPITVPATGNLANDGNQDGSFGGNFTFGTTTFNNVKLVLPGSTLIGQTLTSDGTVIQAGDILGANGAPDQNNATRIGQLKFEAQAGLTLAHVNTRLAEINTVIESLAKVLAVQSDIFNQSAGLIR